MFFGCRNLSCHFCNFHHSKYSIIDNIHEFVFNFRIKNLICRHLCNTIHFHFNEICYWLNSKTFPWISVLCITSSHKLETLIHRILSSFHIALCNYRKLFSLSSIEVIDHCSCWWMWCVMWWHRNYSLVLKIMEPFSQSSFTSTETTLYSRRLRSRISRSATISQLQTSFQSSHGAYSNRLIQKSTSFLRRKNSTSRSLWETSTVTFTLKRWRWRSRRKLTSSGALSQRWNPTKEVLI